MKALISPNETIFSYEGNELGKRVAQVVDTDFPVASPLFWVDCSLECAADEWYYNNGELYPIPLAPVPEDIPSET